MSVKAAKSGTEAVIGQCYLFCINLDLTCCFTDDLASQLSDQSYIIAFVSTSDKLASLPTFITGKQGSKPEEHLCSSNSWR